jgi:hypothetical protein
MKVGEVADSMLEDILRLRDQLDMVLHPQDGTRADGSEPRPLHSVKMIGEVEAIWETLLEVRYLIRDTLDRLAL